MSRHPERSACPNRDARHRAALRGGLLPLASLLAGALMIATSGIFVRLSETGPTATGFWRAALALPLLAAWALLENRDCARGGNVLRRLADSFEPAFLLAGLCFAGDLFFWHWSLLETSVAASTLEANLAPVFVALAAWLLHREQPSARFAASLALALAGVLLIVGPKLGAGAGGAAHAGHAGLRGDLLGLTTAGFYAGYFLVVARLRSRRSTGVLMFWTTLVVALALLPIALTQRFLPVSAHGWLVVAGLAILAQVLGQGLIAYALAHLPATFSSVGLYLQPVAAALYAWWLLGESLAPIQLAGGVVVLAAIAIARTAMSAA